MMDGSTSRRGDPCDRPKKVGAITRLRANTRFAPSAPVSARSQKGVSPFQANRFRPEINRNCVVVSRGGEQREVNDQSVG